MLGVAAGPESGSESRTTLVAAVPLVVFTGYCVLVAKERLRPNDMVAIGRVLAAVVVSMLGRK